MEDLILKYNEDSVLKPNLTDVYSRSVALRLKTAIREFDTKHAYDKDGTPTGVLSIFEHLEAMGFDSKSLIITIKKKR